MARDGIHALSASRDPQDQLLLQILEQSRGRLRAQKQHAQENAEAPLSCKTQEADMLPPANR